MTTSQIPSTIQRYKAQDTGEYQILPMIVMFGNYMLWLIYGLFSDDVFPLATTSSINSTLGLFYSTMFILSTRDRARAIKKLVIGVSITAPFVLYALLGWAGVTNQSTANMADVYGYIVVATTLMFYISPLAKLRRVLRTKSAATIPIGMCAMATLNNCLWFTYAKLIDDYFIMVPTLVCVIFGCIQVGLYIEYRPTKGMMMSDKDEIVVVSVVGMPVDAGKSSSFHAIASPLASPAISSSDA